MDANTCNLVDVFRDRVTTLRNELKMTQEQFADHCGLTLTDINNLTRRKKIPSEVMVAIANKCDVSTDWLLGRTSIRKTITDADTTPRKFDYSKVTVGDLNRILAYAAACGMLQIISPDSKSECVSLRVIDKQLSEFLRRLQKKAIDVITDSDESEYLTDWFEKKCANNDLVAPSGNITSCIDKYHGAFPWNYELSIGKDVDYDLNNAEWCNDSPANEWNIDHLRTSTYAGNCSYEPYERYEDLCDGIAGYYYTDEANRSHHPEHRMFTDPTYFKDDSQNMKIVDEAEVDVPQLP